MNRSLPRRILFLLVAVSLLQACSTAPRAPVSDPQWLDQYQERAAALSARPGWSLQGRLAVNDGEDGGSGSLSWREDPGGSRLDFHGALGRGAWRLTAGRGGATLELADGTRFEASNAEELVRGQLGWEIPVNALAWWVRGLQAPGEPESFTVGEGGTLEFLDQGGWRIEYGRYREVSGTRLPVKLSARQAERTVKLAVRDWDLGE